jgi:hypothetical protein
MKNIHILPTDKPSKIFYIAENFHLEKGQLIEPKSYHNVYITSDEEIKEGDWYCSPYGIISKHNGTEMLPDYWRKIILTTDQDLINCFCTCCGVQGIDDTFLEWFVKNPSCEFVETEVEFIQTPDNLKDGFYFKIIIPKEEPKQETLEEAAKKHINSENKYNRILSGHSFIEGAKWQKERSYSEEDMQSAFFNGGDMKDIEEFNYWFTQFKK